MHKKISFKKIFTNWVIYSFIFIILGGFFSLGLISTSGGLLFFYIVSLLFLLLSLIFALKYLLNRERKIIGIILAIILFISSLFLIICSTFYFFENKDNLRSGTSVAIKADLSSLRAKAELWATDNGESYSGFCENAETKEIGNNIKNLGNNKYKFELYCNDSDKQWAACSNLPRYKNEENKYFCVDYEGTANESVGSCDENWRYLICPEDAICRNLWWYDDNHKESCQEKEFCGLYMYEGLKTFPNPWDCKTDLEETKNEVKDETANWKIYKNEEYGYEVKYPNNWTYREYPDTKTGAGFRPEDKPNDIQFEYINIDVRGATPNAEYNFDDYVKIAGIQEIQNYEKINSIEKIVTKSGITGYKTTWVYRDFQGKTNISLPITYFDYPSSNNEHKTAQISLTDKTFENIYNQMLSTFKFIDSQQDKKEKIIDEILGREGMSEFVTREQLEALTFEDLEKMQEQGRKYDMWQRNNKRVGDLRMIQAELSMYEQDHNYNFPSAIYGSDFFEIYLNGLELKDVLTNEPYLYYLCPNNKHYHLGAVLEEEDSSNNQYLKNDSDAEKCGPGDFSGEDPIYDIYQ